MSPTEDTPTPQGGLAHDTRFTAKSNQVVNLSDVLNADPDFAEDIKAFYTDSIYTDHSDSEREQLVKDRVEEHNDILEALWDK